MYNDIIHHVRRKSMDFSESISSGRWIVSSYSEKHVTINQVNYTNGIIIYPDYIDDKSEIKNISDLTDHHCQKMLKEPCETIFIGTGLMTTIPDDSVIQPLYQANVGFEFMSTLAAIRLLMITTTEKRLCTFCLIF